jgi:hypothetical protein
MRCAALFLVASSACVDFPEGGAVSGSPTDVTTQPGDHTTFSLITDCGAGSGAAYGVIGAGSVKLTDVDDISSTGWELYQELRAIPSVHGGGGAGLVCTPSAVGTHITLNDWRDVDAVIDLTGAWLHERNLALEVAISVQSIDVAHQ